MSLTPAFVLWAILFFTIVLINGVIAWLVVHRAVLRAVRRLCAADLVWAWLAYGALYHLRALDAFRAVVGEPVALWTLCGVVALYPVLRRPALRLGRSGLLFGVLVLAWAGVIAAGFRFVDATAADGALLRERPLEVLHPAAQAPAPLARALLLMRLDERTRTQTVGLVAALTGPAPPDPAVLSAWRLATLPVLLEHYRGELSRLRTYQWVQVAVLAGLLLAWGFGRVPEWETM
jgi:hypothetical protein